MGSCNVLRKKEVDKNVSSSQTQIDRQTNTSSNKDSVTTETKVFKDVTENRAQTKNVKVTGGKTNLVSGSLKHGVQEIVDKDGQKIFVIIDSVLNRLDILVNSPLKKEMSLGDYFGRISLTDSNAVTTSVSEDKVLNEALKEKTKENNKSVFKKLEPTARGIFFFVCIVVVFILGIRILRKYYLNKK